MECPKENCPYRHLGCLRFNKKDPMYACHKRTDEELNALLES